MFPAMLTDAPHWLIASVTLMADGKKRVIPLNPRTLKAGSSTDSRTWGTYEVASAAAEKHGLELCFVFTKELGLVGIDFDPPINDQERANHKQIYDSVESYTELSWSGKGAHIICKGNIPNAVKRNHVELYDWGRFFIMTGKHVAGRPTTIEDCNDVVNAIVEQAGRGTSSSNYIDTSEPAKEEDQLILDRCMKSANGSKFKWLWEGHWQEAYPSQSEADYALLNMLTFATPNDEQVRRLFRQSGLGNRAKALRDAYLNGMIGMIRAEKNPAIDFSQFKAPSVEVTVAPVFKPTPKDKDIEVTYPDGLVGEMAQYVLDTSIKPVPQVALGAGLGLIAGVCGRTYNISNTGLNLYLMLVAGTAIGKEGASQGVTRLIKSVMPKLPAIQQYIGPTEWASGQAMIKQIHQFPCQISVMSEFGHTLRKICSPNANGADIMWRKIILDVFNKSGANDTLGSMVYSDTGKNTPAVNAPALTLLTESSPASLYESLDEQAIEIGLVPRFILMECNDTRPPTNRNAWTPPSAQLSGRLEAVAHRCLSMEANGTHANVALSTAAQSLLWDFDVEVDGYINAQNDDVIRQIWSRAYLKALRVSAVLSVGLNPDKPVVSAASAEWAMQLVRQDAKNMLRRFGEGVGQGDPVQLARLRHVMINVLANGSSKKLKDHNIVSHRLVTQRAYTVACFRNSDRGAKEALRRALDTLADNGEILQLSPQDVRKHFGTGGKHYLMTEQFKLD